MSGNQQTVYIFQCSNNHRRYGATADRAGINLPAQVCPGGSGHLIANYSLAALPNQG
jgi:hypothetical protein